MTSSDPGPNSNWRLKDSGMSSGNNQIPRFLPIPRSIASRLCLLPSISIPQFIITGTIVLIVTGLFHMQTKFHSKYQVVEREAIVHTVSSRAWMLVSGVWMSKPKTDAFSGAYMWMWLTKAMYNRRWRPSPIEVVS